MEGQNVVKTINKYNELINKANVNGITPSNDEKFFICNIELALAESILKDFDKNTSHKLAQILLAETM